MKQVQLPCCMGGVRVTVKNKWTNMSKNKRNFIITELLLGVLLVIGIGFIGLSSAAILFELNVPQILQR